MVEGALITADFWVPSVLSLCWVGTSLCDKVNGSGTSLGGVKINVLKVYERGCSFG